MLAGRVLAISSIGAVDWVSMTLLWDNPSGIFLDTDSASDNGHAFSVLDFRS